MKHTKSITVQTFFISKVYILKEIRHFHLYYKVNCQSMFFGTLVMPAEQQHAQNIQSFCT